MSDAKTYALMRLSKALQRDGVTQAKIDKVLDAWRESGASEPTFLDVLADVSGGKRNCALKLIYRSLRASGPAAQEVITYIDDLGLNFSGWLLDHLGGTVPPNAISARETSYALIDRGSFEIHQNLKIAHNETIKVEPIRDVICSPFPDALNDTLTEDFSALGGLEQFNSLTHVSLGKLDEIRRIYARRLLSLSRAQAIEVYLCSVSPRYKAAREARHRRATDIATLMPTGPVRIEDFGEPLTPDPVLAGIAFRDYAEKEISDAGPFPRYLVSDLERRASLLFKPAPPMVLSFIAATAFETKRLLNARLIGWRFDNWPERRKSDYLTTQLAAGKFPGWIVSLIRAFWPEDALFPEECAVLSRIALGAPEMP